MIPRFRIPSVLALAGGVLAALALPATAQDVPLPSGIQAAAGAPRLPHPPFERLRHCLSILDLTDAQKADIKAVFDAAKPQFDTLAATLKADRDALTADLAKTPPDPCAVGNDALKLHADREAMRTFLTGVRDQVLALLTDAQKAKLTGCLEAERLTAGASALTPDGV